MWLRGSLRILSIVAVNTRAINVAVLTEGLADLDLHFVGNKTTRQEFVFDQCPLVHRPGILGWLPVQSADESVYLELGAQSLSLMFV